MKTKTNSAFVYGKRIVGQRSRTSGYYLVLVLSLLIFLNGCKKFEDHVADLKSENSEKRASAAKALGDLGDARAVEPLIATLKDNNSFVRRYSIEALGKIGDDRAFEPLLAALKDSDLIVRYNVAAALDKIGVEKMKPVQQVIYYIYSKKFDEIAQIGQPAVEPLIAELKNYDSDVCTFAVEALGKIGQPAIEPLIAAMKDKDEKIRQFAYEALGRIGAEKMQPVQQAIYYIYAKKFDEAAKIGQPAVEPLLAVLKDKDTDVRNSAALALGKIGDTRSVEPLISILKKDENCTSAAEALGMIGIERMQPAQRAIYCIYAKRPGDPYFIADPKAEIKLKQIHDGRVLDTEANIKNRIDELRKESGCEHENISVVGVILTDNIRFCTAPALGIVFESPAKMLFIVRADSNEAVVATVRGHSTTFLADLDRTDAEIRRALDAMQKSKLPNPAVIVIDNKVVDDEKFDGIWSALNVETGHGLTVAGKESDFEGQIIFPNTIPPYLLGNGKTCSAHDLIKSFQKPGFGCLSDLIVFGSKNTSRDYYDLDGKSRYFFINTRNSAPVELGKSDIENISSTQVLSVHGISAVIMSMKNGDMVTFGGLSVVNPDFLKSDDEKWKTVLGLSSPNGFTIAVDYVDEDKAVRVSGDDIRKNTLNIQDKLPKSVVEMILMAVPGVESLMANLKNTDENIRKAAVAALGEMKDARAVDSLILALRDNNVDVRQAAVYALGNIKDAKAVDSLIVVLKEDEKYEVRQSAAEVLGKIGQPAVEPLIATLKDNNSFVRRYSIEVLGKIGDDRAFEPLLAALKDSDLIVRRCAVAALVKINAVRAIEPLIDILKDQDANGREIASFGLSLVGAPAIKPLLEHYSATANKDEWIQIILAVCGHEESIAKVLEKLNLDTYSVETKTRLIGYVHEKSFLVRIEEASADIGLRVAARVARLGEDEWVRVIGEAIDKPEILESTLSAFSYSQTNTSVAEIKVQEVCHRYIRRGDNRTIPQLTRLLDKYGSQQLAEDYLNCGQGDLSDAAIRWARSHGYDIRSHYGSAGSRWGSGN